MITTADRIVFVLYVVSQLLLLLLLVLERYGNRRFKRQQAKPPVVHAVPLHPDALRNRQPKEK
jgi:hypothetical protein